MKTYPDTHMQGMIEVNSIPNIKSLPKMIIGDIGIEIEKDGRIWICIDGVCFLRFKPLTEDQLIIAKGEIK